MLERGLFQIQKTLGLGEKYFKEEENDKGIRIRLAVPGAMDPSEFKVTMNSHRLKVLYPGNIFCNSFIYIYPLPRNIDKQNSSADLENGILIIIIPKN
jgi:HSP20 family molecular chaperone IbpA